MFSGVGWPALVPILMPGGMARSVAELVPADDKNAAHPRAALANSLRARFNVWSLFFADSRLLICVSPSILKLGADGRLDVSLPGAEVRKVPEDTGKPGPGGRAVQIVGGIRSGKIRVFPGQVVPIQPQAELQPFVPHLPALGGEALHPQDPRSLQYPGGQRTDRVRVGVREGADIEVRVLLRRGKTVDHLPAWNFRLVNRHQGVDPGGSQVLIGTAAITHRERYAGQNVLAQLHLPPTQYAVYDAASIEPAFTFANRQFISHVRPERFLLVVRGPRVPFPGVVRH